MVKTFRDSADMNGAFLDRTHSPQQNAATLERSKAATNGFFGKCLLLEGNTENTLQPVPSTGPFYGPQDSKSVHTYANNLTNFLPLLNLFLPDRNLCIIPRKSFPAPLFYLLS